MMDAYRLVSDGVFLTVAKVSFDSTGRPATAVLLGISEPNESNIAKIADQIIEAIALPSIPIELLEVYDE